MSKFYNLIVSKHYHAVMRIGSRSGLTIWVHIVYLVYCMLYYKGGFRPGDYVLVVKFSGGGGGGGIMS